MRALLLVALFAGDAMVAPGGMLPRGTQLVARMNTTIGTTRSLGVEYIADETRAGAPFAATIEAAVVDDRGRQRLPPGALLHGHVARLETGHGIEPGEIELAIDRLELRPVAAHVVDLEVEQHPSTDVAVQVESTAFWGMLVGGMAFGIPGVAIGHGVAGSFGSVNAVRGRRVEAWISAGSPITVELDAPFALERCFAAGAAPATC